MRAIWKAAIVSAFLPVSVPATAGLLSPDAYRSFIESWQPSDEPLCAVLQSQADWDKLMHPAPVVGSTKAFAPPPTFWKDTAILLVARVIYAGDTSGVFQLSGVKSGAGGLEADYRFRPNPKASSTMKWWLGMTVRKPLPQKIEFKENGRAVCTLEPKSGNWIEPAQAGRPG